MAKIESVEPIDPWTKAGVMIRDNLNAGSKFAPVYVTPSNGCRFQVRDGTNIDARSDTSISTAEQRAIKAPCWIKLECEKFGNFRGYYSNDGISWQQR